MLNPWGASEGSTTKKVNEYPFEVISFYLFDNVSASGTLSLRNGCLSCFQPIAIQQ